MEAWAFQAHFMWSTWSLTYLKDTQRFGFCHLVSELNDLGVQTLCECADSFSVVELGGGNLTFTTVVNKNDSNFSILMPSFPHNTGVHFSDHKGV